MQAQEEFPPFGAADYITNAEEALVMLETAIEDAPTDPHAVPTALTIIARSGHLDEVTRRLSVRN